MVKHARYEILDPLGHGASSRVFRVRDREAPERALALKRLSTSGGAAVGLFEAEFALLSRVRIAGLVRAHDFGRDDQGVPFLVEDFVESQDFDAVVGQRSERAKQWLVDVLLTLAALHDAGFVHGDLKPEHVRLPAHGRPVLVDLGCALELRGAGAREAVGLTRAYAAPEVLAGASPDVRSDLFGLGATFLALVGASAAQPNAARREAPWIAPSLVEVVAALVAVHPADRPRDARSALALLGRHPALKWEEHGRTSVGREDAIAEILEANAASVRYVVGPSGAGKSHTVREAGLRALVMGREVRTLRFPLRDASVVAPLVAFLRSADAPNPFFVAPGTAERPLLIILDDLHRAPVDLLSALDAYRCRVVDAGHSCFVAAVRSAPPDAAAIAIGPLDSPTFARLCAELGVETPGEVARLEALSARLPGWLVAAMGKVPLSPDAALERLRGASEGAHLAIFALAIADAALHEDRLARILGPVAGEVFAELARMGVVNRRTEIVELATSHVADDLATALATFDRVDRLATALLVDPEVPARVLLRAANAETPPARRVELLALAAERASHAGERHEELDALFALSASASERTLDRVLRLERLARDSGQARIHPQVLGWLDELASSSLEARALVLRRKAELAAREGRVEDAARLAEEAVGCSAKNGVLEGYALSTKGAVALYHGDYASADEHLTRARSALSLRVTLGSFVDREELARLDHNFGVVALARGRLRDATEAFERSIATKRSLGDRAGVRSCLLNLGLALSKLGEYERAQSTLEEAVRLAQALDQKAGLAWCLAARADLEVRRRDPEAATRFVAEAAAMADALPAVVRADLCLLRAEVAVLEGDGARAERSLAELDPALVASDDWVAIRALILEARAKLARLPADRRASARLAITAMRRARTHALPELEAAAQEALKRARSQPGEAPWAEARYALHVPVDAFAVLERFAAGGEPEAAIHELLVAARAACGSERAFLIAFGHRGGLAAFGVDLDDEPIPEAERRVEIPSLEGDASSPVVYHRDVTTKAGRGSRLVVLHPALRPSVALVLEHRFRVGAFDGIDPAEVARWCVLGAVLVRSLASPAAEPDRVVVSLPHARNVPAVTTDVPLRASTRAFPTIMGASSAMTRAFAKLDAACDADLPVVLSGETGTGKELFARALHDQGRRARRAFVAVNCAAIPDALFEAELFGHARGAFTGADKARAGLLVRAEGGTLLLDEVAELSPARQATLLRVLETRMLRPVGADDERPFDVRIVSATHRNLDEAVAAGAFREDLLYRLRVLAIEVPALRERGEDVALLARSFLRSAGSRAELSKRTIAILEAYPWPGNVRELSHVMARLATLDVERIESKHLPRAIRAAVPDATVSQLQPSDDQRGEIERALASTGGNISHAANLLGVTRQGLKKRMVRLGLRKASE